MSQDQEFTINKWNREQAGFITQQPDLKYLLRDKPVVREIDLQSLQGRKAPLGEALNSKGGGFSKTKNKKPKSSAIQSWTFPRVHSTAGAPRH